MKRDVSKRGCKYEKQDGRHCRAIPLAGGAYCFWHDPKKSVARKSAGRTGGLRGRAKTLPSWTPNYRIRDASSIMKLLTRTINQTLKGEIDTKVANTVGYLSGVMLRAREQSVIEERVTKIEETLMI